MPKFIKYDYKQDTMLVINFEEQLQAGTFEYAIHYLIDNKLDLSIFYPKFHNHDIGRPAYDPAILLKIILFAYSKGITSSREIEWCYRTNVIFKALSCDSMPHFTTIADFVSSRSKEIESLFEQILLVCHQQGLLGNELCAIDGCKTPSNASKEWSGTFKEPPLKYVEWMKQRVDSPEGKHIYSHRMSVVEPVFGNVDTNKKLNRFSLRGKTKVDGQWKLFCLIHNIEKLNNYGELAA